jgi:hypothetical protein
MDGFAVPIRAPSWAVPSEGEDATITIHIDDAGCRECGAPLNQNVIDVLTEYVDDMVRTGGYVWHLEAAKNQDGAE